MGYWVRDHGSLRLGGGIGERPWVSEARWGAG